MEKEMVYFKWDWAKEVINSGFDYDRELLKYFITRKTQLDNWQSDEEQKYNLTNINIDGIDMFDYETDESMKDRFFIELKYQDGKQFRRCFKFTWNKYKTIARIINLINGGNKIKNFLAVLNFIIIIPYLIIRVVYEKINNKKDN